jgi:drug/metabolite transporter (DMT)-like permease
MVTAGSGLPLTAAVAVLGAAVAHATWNAIAHGFKDRLAAFALIGLGGLVPAVPMLLLAAPPAPASRGYLGVSVLLHIAYQLLLMRCYRLGEFSQVYPLARGISPVLVTGAAWLLVGEHLSGPQLAGVLLIPAGLACLVFIGRRPGRPALAAAAGTGLAIASYTTVDGIGVRLSGSAAGYIGWLMTLEGLAIPAAAIVIRRGALAGQVRGVWPVGLAGGVLSTAAYGLVLWAQTHAALALVAALRETSIVIGAVIGSLIFREPFGRPRIAATILVVAGILLLNTG